MHTIRAQTECVMDMAMDSALASCVLSLQLETRDFEQIGQIHAALEAAGYHLLRT